MNRTHTELVRDTEPFPDKMIQELPPRGDRYVPWVQYAQRLLLHYGGYTWQVGEVIHADNTWAVIGTLYLGEQPDADSQSYSAVGEDDSPTAAESNAFKRACAKAGIGLHLYENIEKGNPYWLHNQLAKDAVADSDEPDGDPEGVRFNEAATGDDKDVEDKQYADDDPQRPF